MYSTHTSQKVGLGVLLYGLMNPCSWFSNNIQNSHGQSIACFVIEGDVRPPISAFLFSAPFSGIHSSWWDEWCDDIPWSWHNWWFKIFRYTRTSDARDRSSKCIRTVKQQDHSFNACLFPCLIPGKAHVWPDPDVFDQTCRVKSPSISGFKNVWGQAKSPASPSIRRPATPPHIKRSQWCGTLRKIPWFQRVLYPLVNPTK